jgi:uncharacterized membrane protein
MTAGSSAAVPAPAPPSEVGSVELAIARLLFAGSLAGVALLLVGVLLMAAAGIDPTRGSAPPFDPARLVGDVVALRPEGFLWAGIVVLVATPIARVIGELIAFSLRRDRPMVLVAIAVLGIIGLSVAVAIGTEA